MGSAILLKDVPERKRRVKKGIIRGGIYLAGIVILALGLTLNTKTGLGVSPIISVPYAISQIWFFNFAATTFVAYVLFIGVQWLLRPGRRTWKLLLQVPFTLVFSLLLDLFGALPDVSGAPLAPRLLLLIPAFLCTGVGVGMILYMRLVPNPADGMAQAVGEALGKDTGFGKNVVDLVCVAITCTVSLAAAGRVIGIGIGTLLAALCVGRVISLFSRLFRAKLERAAGLERQAPAPAGFIGAKQGKLP